MKFKKFDNLEDDIPTGTALSSYPSRRSSRWLLVLRYNRWQNLYTNKQKNKKIEKERKREREKERKREGENERKREGENERRRE